MAWTKIGENLYQDTTTGKIGVLKRNSGGGLFVADSGAYSAGKYKKDTTPSYKKDTQINRDIRRYNEIATDYEKEAMKIEKQKATERRLNGELSEKYKEYEDLQRHKERVARDYRNSALKLEDERQRQTMNSEFGISVKENQLKSLKTAGNVTQNTANLENAYIEQKNIRTKLNKKGMNKANSELINKDFNAELNYANAKQKYSAFYGNEATNEVTKEAQLSLDRKSLSKDGYKNKMSQDEVSNPREAVNYYLKKGEFSKADQYMKDYGLEDERSEFIDGLNPRVARDYNKYLDDTSPMSEYSDTTGTGLSDKQHTTLSKMPLSELRKTAKEYNIDTTGLSRQKLMAKLIAIFK